ncbi:MAG: GNAT family N-acetyltransferase [Pseudomonadota bacterium]
MTEAVTLRAAKSNDLPTLQAFEQGIILAERPYDATLKPDPINYYDIGEMIEDPDAEVAVAEINGELVASGYAIKKASRHYVSPAYHAFIGFLFVVPEHRGKGLNQKILKHLFAWAQTVGLPEVHLTVYPGNVSAIRAYEKVGFKPYLSEMRLNLEEF